MMKGTNEIVFNVATMIMVVEHYLKHEVFRHMDFKVTAVERTTQIPNNVFKITIESVEIADADE